MLKGVVGVSFSGWAAVQSCESVHIKVKYAQLINTNQ